MRGRALSSARTNTCLRTGSADSASTPDGSRLAFHDARVQEGSDEEGIHALLDALPTVIWPDERL